MRQRRCNWLPMRRRLLGDLGPELEKRLDRYPGVSPVRRGLPGALQPLLLQPRIERSGSRANASLVSSF
jgi:hypothetical protein